MLIGLKFVGLYCVATLASRHNQDEVEKGNYIKLKIIQKLCFKRVYFEIKGDRERFINILSIIVYVYLSL